MYFRLYISTLHKSVENTDQVFEMLEILEIEEEEEEVEEEVDIKEQKVKDDKDQEEEEENEKDSVEIKRGQGTFEGEDSTSIYVAEDRTTTQNMSTENDHAEISPASKIGCGIVDMDHLVDNLFKIAYTDEKIHKKNLPNKTIQKDQFHPKGFRNDHSFILR